MGALRATSFAKAAMAAVPFTFPKEIPSPDFSHSHR